VRRCTPEPYPLYTRLRESAGTSTEPSPAADADASERILAAAIEAARAAWPSFTLSLEVFLPYLARWLTSVSPQALERLRIVDLYLACACAQGDAAAIAAFETAHLRDIASVLPRQAKGVSLEGDVTQAVREKLFVRRAGAPPHITEYAGRGDLASWVHVVAVRTALNMMRGRKRQAELDGRQVLAASTGARDEEIAYLKQRYRVEFAEAFHAALATLEPRDRNVLRQHYVDGLTMEEIGVVYRVHRITVVRWVERARDTVAKETKRKLAGKLRLGKGELESILRLVRSELDLSLRKHLR
jgi:RNA polymerase sigma-70 factor (ECF subfamily)